jgi:hypothetical protein
MFKKLVPVLALALLAGPAFAADAPASAPATDKPAATSTTHQKKHHSKKTKAASTTGDSSTAPAK